MTKFQRRRQREHKRWYRKYKEEIKRKNNEYYHYHAQYACELRRKRCLEAKLASLAHYGPNGIIQCSWSGCLVNDPDMLSIDHINNDGAEDRKRATGKNHYKRGHYERLVKSGFPPGYQTLCWNHQWKKEIMRRAALRKY